MTAVLILFMFLAFVGTDYLVRTTLRKAREKAAQERKALNVLFREWVVQYVRQGHGGKYRDLMKQLSYASAGKKFSREELNER